MKVNNIDAVQKKCKAKIFALYRCLLYLCGVKNNSDIHII